MAANKIRAAVFDFDGMIFDTRDLMFKTYTHALVSHGYPAPKKEDIFATVGKQVHDSYASLAIKKDIEAIVETHREFQNRSFHLVTPYAGLKDVLNQLDRTGIRMAVFTSRGPTSTISTLKKAGVLRFFKTVITADDVVNHKPHPEGLLKAIKALRVSPGSTAMLGDSVYDIESGRQAKVALTVGVTHGFGTRASLEKAKADFIVDSLSEILPILLGKMVGDEG